MPRNRRPIIVTGVVLGSLALLAGAFWGGSILAQVEYDRAAAISVTALHEQDEAQHAYDARVRNGENESARVGSVIAAPEFGADGSAEAGALRASLEELGALAAPDVAGGVGDTADPSTDSTGYVPPWQLLADAGALHDRAKSAAADRDDLLAATSAANDAQDTVDDAEAAYFSAVAARGTNDIATNTLATKSTQVALTRLIEQADDRSQSASRDGAFLASFVAAENAVFASQSAEAAELADPALAVRREIEDYARSLSNEMTLEFVWAPEVNGKGEGWLSGTAETYQSDGGWAIISLNYGVEEDWGLDENPRALVAHEVGHTQAYRPACTALFTGPVFNSDDEMWATAWSISLGFDLPGSGIEAYGRPSDEQIAVAGQCR